jgi:hypothetical protein
MIKILDFQNTGKYFTEEQKTIMLADAIKKSKKIGLDIFDYHHDNIEYHHEYGYFNVKFERMNKNNELVTLVFQIVLSEKSLYLRYDSWDDNHKKLNPYTLMLIQNLGNQNTGNHKFNTLISCVDYLNMIASSINLYNP